MNTLTNEQKNTIIEQIQTRLKADTIILFGSAARGEMRDDSDVDIAFISKEDSSPYQSFMIAQELAEKLNREVDLIDFAAASTVFQTQIMETGILLLDDAPLRRQYAFMRALKEYALLNDERKVILQSLGYKGGVDDE